MSASFLMVRCNKSLYAYYSKRLQLYQRISICNISYLYSVMGMGKAPLIKVSLYQNVSCILYNIMVEVEYEKMNSNIDVDTNVLEAVFIPRRFIVLWITLVYIASMLLEFRNNILSMDSFFFTIIIVIHTIFIGMQVH